MNTPETQSGGSLKPVGSAVCHHGHLSRSCCLCELEALRDAMAETVLVGFDCAENTIKLRLPSNKSIRGLTTGQIIEVVMPNAAGEPKPRKPRT